MLRSTKEQGGSTRTVIQCAADEAPRCCMANVYAGFLWMLLEAPDAARSAAKYVTACAAAAGDCTARERLNVEMLRAWAADDMPLVFRLCDKIAAQFPRDLVIVKLHQYFEFNRGGSPAMLRIALRVLERNADQPYMHGMAAFAYEQCHLLDEAEHEARAALALRRKEPWAQHALAHVMLTRGRIDEGVEFLEGMADTWTGLNSFMSTHLWWHLALLYLSQGRRQKVLEVYDRYCWGISKSYSQDQIGAISLLARFEIAGIDVGTRWQDVGVHVASRAHDTVQPFLTLQYVYALTRAGRPEALTLLASAREHARSAPLCFRAVWRDVALPGCEALHAYARGDYDTAWQGLEAIMSRMAEVGGSHAQRDLFEQILLDAAMKSGRAAAAQQMLELRRRADPDGVPLNTALSVVYTELGLPALAEQARARAASTVARHR